MQLRRITKTKSVIAAVMLVSAVTVWPSDSASALTCTYSVSNGGHTANAHCPYNNSTGTFKVTAFLCSSQGCGNTQISPPNCTYYGNTSSVTTTGYVDPSRIGWVDCGVGG